jgi:hypothetical protein
MKKATRGDLRQFGLLTGSAIAALFGGLSPWLRAHPHPVWPLVVGGVLISGGVIYPPVLRYPFALWSALGEVLGWINSRVILTLLFFAVVTPIGLVMRLIGRDAMARKFEPELSTYRVPSRRTSIQSLERPF